MFDFVAPMFLKVATGLLIAGALCLAVVAGYLLFRG
jgi:hypothetical protein